MCSRLAQIDIYVNWIRSIQETVGLGGLKVGSSGSIFLRKNEPNIFSKWARLDQPTLSSSFVFVLRLLPLLLHTIFGSFAQFKFSNGWLGLPSPFSLSKTPETAKSLTVNRSFMDSVTTPPPRRSHSHSQTKSASRLTRMCDYEGEEVPRLTVDLMSSSPKKRGSSSTLTLRSSDSLPLQDLLLLSPSPLRRSRTHASDQMADELMELARSRRRRKTKGSAAGLFGCASPKGMRRSRRRSELETKEERDSCLGDEVEKPRKVRHILRSNKEKLSLVPSVSLPSSTTSPKFDTVYRDNIDQVGELITDLIMWKDVAKSTLWFGFGCLFFLSSFFAGGVSFSIFSAISRLGLLVLGASFFSNTFSQRNNIEKKQELTLKEDDILQALKIFLPAANLAISKLRVLFSGEPSTTLKLAPFLLLGIEYGRLITIWRLCVTGYFLIFTAPKLYSCYQTQISEKVDRIKCRCLEAWGACSHKKIVITLVVTAFWNLSTLKTRLFTAFISLVIHRYHQQNMAPYLGEEFATDEQKALVEAEVKKEDQALVW